MLIVLVALLVGIAVATLTASNSIALGRELPPNFIALKASQFVAVALVGQCLRAIFRKAKDRKPPDPLGEGPVEHASIRAELLPPARADSEAIPTLYTGQWVGGLILTVLLVLAFLKWGTGKPDSSTPPAPLPWPKEQAQQGTESALPEYFEPSFKCGPRITEAERVICTDQSLSDLDKAMAEKYVQVFPPGSRQPSAALKASQFAWLKERDACLSTVRAYPTTLGEDSPARDCMVAAYRRRIRELAKWTDPQSVPPTLPRIEPKGSLESNKPTDSVPINKEDVPPYLQKYIE